MTTYLVGKTLGQYELVEVAGEGGLATVYKAYQRPLNRWVAVKVLHVHEKEVLTRFKREARAIAQLRHRNILMVYEYGEADEWPYIVMEYVEGGTLAGYLEGQPMDWLKVVGLAVPIAEALHHAHEQGLVHRDVKPSNILMPQEDWPLLTDFGLVKIRDAQESITMSGVVMGTPSYISPEQAQGQKAADRRIDVYALGVIMFEMITGRLPFNYKNTNLLMLAHISEPPPSPRKLNPKCPPGLEKVILKALNKSPDDRYADMQALIEALHDLIGQSTLPFAAGETPFPQPSGPPLTAQFPPRPSAPEPGSTRPVPESGPAGNRPQLLLSESKVTLTLSESTAAGAGLIIGRTHAKNRAEVDLGPHGAAKAGISRRHARLFKRDSQWQIEDLGSLNGTFVNGARLKSGQPQPLKNGDTIRCSLMSLVFLAPE